MNKRLDFSFWSPDFFSGYAKHTIFPFLSHYNTPRTNTQLTTLNIFPLSKSSFFSSVLWYYVIIVSSAIESNVSVNDDDDDDDDDNNNSHNNNNNKLTCFCNLSIIKEHCI